MQEWLFIFYVTTPPEDALFYKPDTNLTPQAVPCARGADGPANLSQVVCRSLSAQAIVISRSTAFNANTLAKPQPGPFRRHALHTPRVKVSEIEGRIWAEVLWAGPSCSSTAHSLNLARNKQGSPREVLHDIATTINTST